MANFLAFCASMLIFMGLNLYGVPLARQAENWLSPIIRFNNERSLYRDENKACFALSITKLHAAIPLKYVFFVETRLSTRIPVAAYVTERDLVRHPSDDLETHKIGTTWDRYYCFETPQTVADAQEMRVTGEAIHRRHPFYRSVTPVPPFDIGPLRS